jgi:hypothetical protein
MPIPKIQAYESAQILDVLRKDGLVEPQLNFFLFDHFLRGVGPEHRGYGIPRHDPQHDEYQGQQDEDHWDGQKEPRENVA